MWTWASWSLGFEYLLYTVNLRSSPCDVDPHWASCVLTSSPVKESVIHIEVSSSLFMFQTERVQAPIRSPARTQTCSLHSFQCGKFIFCVSLPRINVSLRQSKQDLMHEEMLITTCGHMETRRAVRIVLKHVGKWMCEPIWLSNLQKWHSRTNSP